MSELETVALYGEGKFPLAVARKSGLPNIAEMSAKAHGHFSFGVNRENTAAALRLLADQIDAGAVVPQSMTDSTTAEGDDFVLRTVTFVFVEQHQPDNPDAAAV